MYNLIEYSDNYSDTLGSLWQFKSDDVPAYNADLTVNDSQSFKYKAAYVGKTANYNDGKSSVVVPLKYLSNFRRSFEMPLINCKVHLELNLIEDCIFSSAEDSAKLEITDAKLHVSIVTLFTKDSVKLTKLLSEKFKRSVYRNNYQTKPAKEIERRKTLYELIYAAFQGVRRLFVLVMLLLQVLQMSKQA